MPFLRIDSPLLPGFSSWQQNPILSRFWNATYESLLGSNKPFARPVPLAVSPFPLSSLVQIDL
ncbi:hypothetical protein NC651_038136 [Populus alba x Populus x berolinensis]|nr:hypothetical protein NC651_038136 [Populus alba x Populus x berolinensis]